MNWKHWRFPIVAALGAMFVAATFSWGFIAGIGEYWQTPQGDAADALIGWLYYARDAWHFPLFLVTSYHAPEGSYVTLSDSLPLMALASKALYALFGSPSGEPWIYIGLWCAGCFMLQVIAASRLLVSLNVANPLQHISGILLLAFVPWFFYRFGQFGLLVIFFC